MRKSKTWLKLTYRNKSKLLVVSGVATARRLNNGIRVLSLSYLGSGGLIFSMNSDKNKCLLSSNRSSTSPPDCDGLTPDPVSALDGVIDWQGRGQGPTPEPHRATQVIF